MHSFNTSTVKLVICVMMCIEIFDLDHLLKNTSSHSKRFTSLWVFGIGIKKLIILLENGCSRPYWLTFYCFLCKQYFLVQYYLTKHLVLALQTWWAVISGYVWNSVLAFILWSMPEQLWIIFSTYCQQSNTSTLNGASVFNHWTVSTMTKAIPTLYCNLLHNSCRLVSCD